MQVLVVLLSTHKARMKNAIETELDDLLLEGLPDLVSPTDLSRRLSGNFGYSEAGLINLVGRWLTGARAARHKRYTRTATNKAMTLWSLRDHERYAAMGPAARVAAYREQSR